MAMFAMIDIFSGLPNPAWPINDDLAQQMMQVSNSGSGSTDSDSAGLGYRGFKIIESETDIGGATATTVDTLGAFTERAVIVGNGDAERSLLDAGVTAGAINQDLSAYVSQNIGGVLLAGGGGGGAGGAGGGAGGSACPPCGGTTSPAYGPAFWNDPARQPFNNCYAYANNQATGTFPQPGRGTGQIFTSLDCDGVRPAAERDGLVTTDTFQASREGWYVALVIWPGQDYHWYRQDDVGCWSHKPGQTRARNVDNSGQAIADPQQCDRGPYTVFCTFMVTNAGVTIS